MLTDSEANFLSIPRLWKRKEKFLFLITVISFSYHGVVDRQGISFQSDALSLDKKGTKLMDLPKMRRELIFIYMYYSSVKMFQNQMYRIH